MAVPLRMSGFRISCSWHYVQQKRSYTQSPSVLTRFVWNFASFGQNFSLQHAHSKPNPFAFGVHSSLRVRISGQFMLSGSEWALTAQVLRCADCRYTERHVQTLQ